MRRTRKRATSSGDESSTTESGIEAPEEEIIIEEGDEPQTLSDVPKPKRGYFDRMLRPSRMDERVWAGRALFRCPRCGEETFSRETAERHNC